MDAPKKIRKAKITVLLASHNRRDSTIRALKNLYQQQGVGRNFELSAVLVDDGSTDGMAEEVKRQLPVIKVVHGDGDLFWCGGMCLAYENARNDEADFYLFVVE